MHDPIAYTYDADYHCEGCAAARFGRGPNGFIGEFSTDSEGNPVGVVAPWDEWWNLDGECETLACGTCHGLIDTVHLATCEENLGDDPCTLPEHARA